MASRFIKYNIQNILFILTGILFICVPVVAQEDDAAKGHKSMSHKNHGGHKKKQTHKMEHGGHHGMVFKDAKKFPTIAYNETKLPRPVSKPTIPKIKGDPEKGKALAYAKSKGRCLACHIMEADADQGGNVGPNLSTYGNLSRDKRYTFQQIWDARAHNPKTLMPPFGTNGILKKHEVIHIAAYLSTLKIPVRAPKRAQIQERNFYIAGEDFTLADIYIEDGESLFHKAGKNGESCASCHSSKNTKAPKLKSVATTYPKYDSGAKKVIGLEQRINICQKKYKHSKPYRLGSRESNIVTSYVKYLSRSLPINVSIKEHAEKSFKRGKLSFFKKAGQLNFSCADCHTSSAGKWLRGQPLSSIKPEGKHSYTASTWPKHFIAGHDLGLISLRQRIRHCQVVTRTYPLKLHSQEYTDLELYLTTLANGKPMLAPTKSKLRGSD